LGWIGTDVPTFWIPLLDEANLRLQCARLFYLRFLVMPDEAQLQAMTWPPSFVRTWHSGDMLYLIHVIITLGQANGFPIGDARSARY
jgi:hypothetical protein